MNHAREAIGAVQTGPSTWLIRWGDGRLLSIGDGAGVEHYSFEGANPGASAHEATGGQICEPATRAGTPPAHFPCEPSGAVAEKLEPENSRD